jgi:hypothetical protein
MTLIARPRHQRIVARVPVGEAWPIVCEEDGTVLCEANTEYEETLECGCQAVISLTTRRAPNAPNISPKKGLAVDWDNLVMIERGAPFDPVVHLLPRMFRRCREHRYAGGREPSAREVWLVRMLYFNKHLRKVGRERARANA